MGYWRTDYSIWILETTEQKSFLCDIFYTVRLLWNISPLGSFTAQKMFGIKDFFSKYGQIRSFLQIWPYLLKKFFMEFFCVQCFDLISFSRESIKVIFMELIGTFMQKGFSKNIILKIYPSCWETSLVKIILRGIADRPVTSLKINPNSYFFP